MAASRGPVGDMRGSRNGAGGVPPLSPWHHIPKEKLSPAMRQTLTILNRRWVIVWLLTLALGFALPLYLNSQRTEQIQTERFNSVVRSCEDTNSRRAKAYATLDTLLAQTLKMHPKQLGRIAQSRTNTRALIDSLVPHQNCAELGRARVSK